MYKKIKSIKCQYCSKHIPLLFLEIILFHKLSDFIKRNFEGLSYISISFSRFTSLNNHVIYRICKFVHFLLLWIKLHSIISRKIMIPTLLINYNNISFLVYASHAKYKMVWKVLQQSKILLKQRVLKKVSPPNSLL